MGGYQNSNEDQPEAISAQNIFRVTASQLKDMFEDGSRQSTHQTRMSDSHTMLYQMGYAHGLCRKLAANPSSGIIGDKKDLGMRCKQFG